MKNLSTAFLALAIAACATRPPPAKFSLNPFPDGSLPACTDVPSIVRWLNYNNPQGLDVATGVEAVKQYQILMGCRTELTIRR